MFLRNLLVWNRVRIVLTGQRLQASRLWKAHDESSLLFRPFAVRRQDTGCFWLGLASRVALYTAFLSAKGQRIL